jgi:hypothetical protein
LDNDCDKKLGDGELDADGDGYLACAECDDSNPAINPGAEEVCDGIDDNCDQVLLEGEVDQDGDGYLACAECNDSDPAINPGAEEICDGIDNNCDQVLLAGELEDQNQNGILACADPNDTQIAAQVMVEPRAFNPNTGKFTAYVKLPAAFDVTIITECYADGAPALFIDFDLDAQVATCKFNREDITVLPLDTIFEVSGATSLGLTFLGVDVIDKLIP